MIETDWLPYPFTMNWQMTRRGIVRFDKDEPICVVFPVPASAVSGVTPEIRDLADDPELEAQMHAWRDRRDEFMQRFRAGDPGDDEGSVAAALLPRQAARWHRRPR